MADAFMTEANVGAARLEKNDQVANSGVSWGAILSGFFVALLVYLGLVALGLAIGGTTIQETVQNWDSAKNLGLGASIWTVVSAVISITVGAYVSGRVAGQISLRVGRTQGVVIVSLFFLGILTQAGLVLGGLGSGITSAISSVTSGTLSTAASAAGERTIEDAIADLKVKAPSAEVVKGIAARLASGDDQGAVTYLARQTGIDPTEASDRYISLKGKVLEWGKKAAVSTGETIKYAGITLFVTILLGTLGAMIGGSLAALYNLRMPVSHMDATAIGRSLKTSHA